MTSKVYKIETSLTLDYRRLKWGLERIVLDGISNHLPADSKGTRTFVKIKQNGQWYNLKTANLDTETEEVVFEDNGFGYDAGLLGVLFSTKAADVLSVGQFGEGIKLISTAALRNCVDIEFMSKNWIARPYAKPEKVGGHDIERLCFEVTEDGDNLNGSRTVIKKPSKELMAEIFKIPEKVLPLNENHKTLYTQQFYLGYSDKIVDLGKESLKGEQIIFVKGVKVQEEKALFSYDLGIEDITPDRVYADNKKIKGRIRNLLKECNNVGVLERILREANLNPKASLLEFFAFYEEPKREEIGVIYENEPEEDKIKMLFKMYSNKDMVSLWEKTFYKIFGEKAVIASSDSAINKDADYMGYTPIKLNYGIATYLKSLGVNLADKIKLEQEYKWVDKEFLTSEEIERLSLAHEINEIYYPDKRVETRTYEGLFTKSGREIEQSEGVHYKEIDGTTFIGIKRSLLHGDDFDFARTYLHELGHEITGKEDYDRAFTDFFIRKLAERTLEKIRKKREQGYSDYSI